MIETIYIARHGFRMNWVNNTWKSETGLARDPPLAAFGETQAKELAEYFLSLPEEQRPTAIYSSPYYRCLQTANPVSAALGVPIYVEHGISEWYSPVAEGTGLHPRPGSAASLKQYFPSAIDPDAWASVWYPSRKGEDVAEMHERAGAVINVLVPEIERRFPGAHRRVLLVSHAATTIALARALVGDRALPMRAGCCSLTELVRKRDVIPILGGWDARRLADGAHLKDGASREWGFEDIEISDGQVVADPGVPGTEHEVDEPVGSQVALSSNL
ncbi:histidine phosphatase superfamily [Mycena belliarum]|uniref:Histidine phosphatase superfamily n=1 Tax=Mycena belliarum TaxID=1033014 RepID=A0AAD6XZH7_9AGAR|nr:histidine phosphatase superfamily [Mycena belliae]